MENESSDSTRGSSALKRLDEAKFSWYHVKILLVNGAGFFTVNTLLVFIIKITIIRVKVLTITD